MKKLFLPLFLLILAVIGFFWWQSTSSDGQIRILATEQVALGPVRKVLEETGIIKSQVGGIVKIGARATGKIDRMLVRVGDRVKAGQLVAQIDNREWRAQEKEARARMEAARSELQRIEKVYPLRIAEAASALELAEARALYSQNNYRRMQELVAEKVVSIDELEQARQQADIDASQVRANRATWQREQEDFAQEKNKAQRAVEQATAALDAISIRLSYTRVLSPMDGLVSQVTAQEGETVVAGLQVANLVTVIDPTRLEMWVYVDETDVGLAQAGQAVEFRVDAYPEQTFSGHISTIYPEPEIRDNIVYYRALVEIDRQQAERLRPEMTTQVQIVVEEKAQVLRLPNSALKWVDGSQVVFVQNQSGAIERATPELGLAGLTHSEVLSGLSEGDLVATQVELPHQRAKEQP
ncbi:MAG: efflux RND transporter periplasmic adaptor subunit [Desulfuromonadaceae bacterium]